MSGGGVGLKKCGDILIGPATDETIADGLTAVISAVVSLFLRTTSCAKVVLDKADIKAAIMEYFSLNRLRSTQTKLFKKHMSFSTKMIESGFKY